MQPVARSARSNRRRLACLLASEPGVAAVGAPGAREIVLDNPVEHEGTVYQSLTIRPPSAVDFAQALRFARGKLDRGMTLVALCCDLPKEVLFKLAEADQQKIGVFIEPYLSA
ncbi:phage tail assembly protein [Methylorubrum extorquens]|uniref:phage tail assembly protein n=1 Tax=Methylorubrum extorquens TaxID=408 RepID=UPI0012DB56AB|nr:phage tail assembly protein [Methylorubrum extorquens]